MLDNVILIPYREREEHLKYFIKNLAPLLEKHIDNLKIVIIEQSHDNKRFNRGKILNVGFKEYGEQSKYCFTHDVDTIPHINIIINIYNNTDYDIFRIHCGHPVSLGGIVKFKCETFKTINGFPNNIWGWGLEDEALFTRAMICNTKMSNYNTNSRNNFRFLPHPSSYNNINLENNFYNKDKDKLFWRWGYDFDPNKLTNEQKRCMIRDNGLDDLEYKIIKKERINDYIEKILVEI